MVARTATIGRGPLRLRLGVPESCWKSAEKSEEKCGKSEGKEAIQKLTNQKFYSKNPSKSFKINQSIKRPRVLLRDLLNQLGNSFAPCQLSWTMSFSNPCHTLHVGKCCGILHIFPLFPLFPLFPFSFFLNVFPLFISPSKNEKAEKTN